MGPQALFPSSTKRQFKNHQGRTSKLLNGFSNSVSPQTPKANLRPTKAAPRRCSMGSQTPPSSSTQREFHRAAPQRRRAARRCSCTVQLSPSEPNSPDNRKKNFTNHSKRFRRAARSVEAHSPWFGCRSAAQRWTFWQKEGEVFRTATRRAWWEWENEEFHFVEERQPFLLLGRPPGLGAARRQPG